MVNLQEINININHILLGNNKQSTTKSSIFEIPLFTVNNESNLSSVRPIVRTSRTAFVCASDYDDRTQFHMFEQKNEHG